MIRRLFAGLVLSACCSTALAAQSEDSVAVARRVAAGAALAAREYHVGTARGGVVVDTLEIGEAVQFVDNALLDVPGLPGGVRVLADTELRALRGMIDRHVSFDSVTLRAEMLVEQISAAVSGQLYEFPTQPPSLVRGQAIFREQCIQCHGPAGRGDGPKAERLVGPPPTNLSDRAFLAGESPLNTYRKIAIGAAGTGMPQYAEALSADDRWALTMYVVMLRSDRGSVTDGERVYAVQCASCHGAAGAGRTAHALNDLAMQSRLSDDDLFQVILSGRSGTTMPSFPRGDSAAVGAVVAYLRSLPVAEEAGRIRLAKLAIFMRVRVLLDSAFVLRSPRMVSDAHLSFQQVVGDVRTYNATLAGEIEDAFADLEARTAAGATPENVAAVRGPLLTRLDRAERLVLDNAGESARLVRDPS